jgi:hypothetical protein
MNRNRRNIARLSNGVLFSDCCLEFAHLAFSWMIFSSLRRELVFIVRLAWVLFSSLMREVC